MNSAPLISIVVPYHDMDNGAFFLKRNIDSIMSQSYEKYEIVLVKKGKMAENTNAGIKKAQGELIKILYMDDYFAKGNSLQEIVDNFEGQWLVTGCMHDTGDGKLTNYHSPSYNDQISTGVNSIGSPSVLTMKKEGCLLFDTQLSWLLDCDLYQRLHQTYGPPKIIDTPNVIIGLHEGQTTHKLSNERKQWEHEYLSNKT